MHSEKQNSTVVCLFHCQSLFFKIENRLILSFVVCFFLPRLDPDNDRKKFLYWVKTTKGKKIDILVSLRG